MRLRADLGGEIGLGEGLPFEALTIRHLRYG